MLTRNNVWGQGGDFSDASLLWYARGVKAMKARALADPTSWRFYAAMHGIDTALWQSFEYWSPTEPQPSKATSDLFWAQCQHGSWYFFPWHRGYVLAFEAMVRAAIVSLRGPATWTLPYWNYFKTGQNALPPAFASPTWPDGNGDNPLFVPQRWGPGNDGNVLIPMDQVNLDAMTDPDFTGVDSGGSPGFGGVDTGFSHGGRVHGLLESQPHDQVHVLVGGADPQDTDIGGLMSTPDTAGLDPIFWLHHANIDRLWEVWRENPPSNANPNDARWLQGPASFGQRAFVAPNPDRSTWTYAPGDVVGLATLGYTYDDLSAAVPAATLADRVQRLRAAPLPQAGTPMTSDKTTELVGASRAVQVQGAETRASIQLDAGVRRKMAATLTAAAIATPPDRVFLNLENIRGKADSTAFHVYVGRPNGPSVKVGNIALFGVRKASAPGGEHGGAGLTFVLEITKIVDQLHLSGGLDVDSLEVRLVPTKPVLAGSPVSIGRISVVRQGGG
jgi:tyrosinase